MANAADTDWKAIGLYAGVFVAGILVGAFLAAPMIQKFKDKKKKTEPAAKP